MKRNQLLTKYLLLASLSLLFSFGFSQAQTIKRTNDPTGLLKMRKEHPKQLQQLHESKIKNTRKQGVISSSVSAGSTQLNASTQDIVINFDDIAIPDDYVTTIPNPYHGFIWTVGPGIDGENPSGGDLGVLPATNPDFTGTGYNTGMVSAPNVAFNPFAGWSIEIKKSNGSAFTFVSGYFTAALQTVHISFRGYNGSTLVQSSTVYTLTPADPTLITLNWSGITKLVIDKTETEGLTQIVMDDFTFRNNEVKVDAGRDKTVYIGYGSHCVNLSADASKGTPPYTYSWSPGGATSSSIEVCPTTTTTYTVTVTDANGNMASDEVVVNVIDVRCGNKGDKVLVCHKGKSLCIADDAVAAHLQHGDQLGSCTVAPSLTSITFKEDVSTLVEQLPESFSVFAAPNPFSTLTRLEYKLPSSGHISIQVFDATGRTVATLVNAERKAGVFSTDFNAVGLSKGVYYYRALFTTEQKQVFAQRSKIIKLN